MGLVSDNPNSNLGYPARLTPPSLPIDDHLVLKNQISVKDKIIYVVQGLHKEFNTDNFIFDEEHLVTLASQTDLQIEHLSFHCPITLAALESLAKSHTTQGLKTLSLSKLKVKIGQKVPSEQFTKCLELWKNIETLQFTNQRFLDITLIMRLNFDHFPKLREIVVTINSIYDGQRVPAVAEEISKAHQNLTVIIHNNIPGDRDFGKTTSYK